MAGYRVVLMRDGVQSTSFLNAQTDADALKASEALVHGAAMELWEGPRLVIARKEDEDLVALVHRMVGLKDGT